MAVGRGRRTASCSRARRSRGLFRKLIRDLQLTNFLLTAGAKAGEERPVGAAGWVRK